MSKTKLEYSKSKNLISSNAKLEKSVKGYLIKGLQLAPHRQAGIGNVCTSASKGCAGACLFSAGMGRLSNVKKARTNKTRYFFYETKIFMDQIANEIAKLEKAALKNGDKLAVRLNTLSDLSFEKIKVSGGKNIFEMFPNVVFYDYTKHIKRALKYVKGEMPKNYHLTFSRSESNDEEVNKALTAGVNVAAVFEELPKEYKGKKVIDGDKNDARFLDEKGVVVGLVAKGDAEKDDSGFVISPCFPV